jgi:hypothetical protein
VAPNDTPWPASPKQKQYLAVLIQQAGFATFADARLALGLTQKQSRGRFTSSEASALIDSLLEAQHRMSSDLSKGNPTTEADHEPKEATVADRAKALAAEKREIARLARQDAERAYQLQAFPAELLADELRRRNWSVTEPVD